MMAQRDSALACFLVWPLAPSLDEIFHWPHTASEHRGEQITTPSSNPFKDKHLNSRRYRLCISYILWKSINVSVGMSVLKKVFSHLEHIYFSTITLTPFQPRKETRIPSDSIQPQFTPRGLRTPDDLQFTPGGPLEPRLKNTGVIYLNLGPVVQNCYVNGLWNLTRLHIWDWSVS